MSSDYQIFNNFLPYPEEIRANILSRPFSDETGPDGALYKRVQVRQPDEFKELLTDALHTRRITQSMSLARLNYEGELPNNAIHSDAGYDDFAAVLYLNLPAQCQGGTAFWRHKNTGFSSLPTPEQVRRVGKSPARVLKSLTSSWDMVEAWRLERIASMVYNRLIVYSTKSFHSRFPFEAFGNSPETGRLVWVTFFNCP